MKQQNLFKGRDKRKRGWFWLDNDYLNGWAKYFGAVGTAIYVSLCRHSNNENQKCFPAMKTIAEETGISENTVKKYIHLFEKFKLIGIEKERDYKTKKWLNNIYTLLDKIEWIQPDKPLWKNKRKKSHSQSLAMETHSQPLSEPQPTIDETHSQPLANKEDSYVRKTYIKEENGAFSEKDRKELIDLFKEVNPNYEIFFARKNQSDALKRMVSKFGREKVENAIKVLPQIINKPYAPRITSPIQLENKLGELKAFYEQEKSKVADKSKIKSVRV